MNLEYSFQNYLYQRIVTCFYGISLLSFKNPMHIRRNHPEFLAEYLYFNMLQPAFQLYFIKNADGILQNAD